MKSFSEIDTTVKRASKSIGFEWGIAEELGKNIRLLEMFGLAGLKNLNSYFKIYNQKQFQKISLISKINTSSIAYCPIISGTNFLDQVINLETMDEINFENMAYPLLFLPFVSRSTEIIGKRIFLNIDEKEFLLNFNQTIYSNFLKSEVINNCKLINISFVDNVNTFSENEWNEIYKISEKTFVEESESLKRDAAGAGLTDND